MAKNCTAGVVPLGTMIRGGEKTLRSLNRFIPIGIESVEIFFWDIIPETADLSWLETIVAKCEQSGVIVSTLGLFANPLRNRETREKAWSDWNTLVDFARHFQIPVVSGFTGRVPGMAVEKSYQPVEKFFSPIVERCLAKGIKLAFENCPMEGDRFEGDWNIAFLPEVWDILLKEIFPAETVGLEFDPAHCVCLGLPALELMDDWMPRIHHIHGKDAATSPSREFRFPGKGSIQWQKLFQLIQTCGYTGSLDIEGYHGQFISHEQEVQNQKKSLKYLKTCRRGQI